MPSPPSAAMSFAYLQCFSDNAAKCFRESASVVVFALVKPKCLFVQIPEQMKRLDVHIGSVQRAFEQTPEILESVRMDVALRVANDVVDNSSVVVTLKIIRT
jgi:hypothetical protein